MIVLGGASIVAGLALLGHKVIQTMGTDMTHIDYVNGFTTELCSGLTVVLASALGVPVSSTHCQVGAIVGVGLVGDRDKAHLTNSGVNWKLFGKIFASWIITVPFSALVAGIIAWLLSYAVTLPRGSGVPESAPFADNFTSPMESPFAQIPTAP
jgi:phosphate/sulfate permease